MTRHRLQRGKPAFFSVLAALRAVFPQQNGDGRRCRCYNVGLGASCPIFADGASRRSFIQLSSASHGQRICDASHFQSVPFGPGA